MKIFIFIKNKAITGECEFVVGLLYIFMVKIFMVFHHVLHHENLMS